MVSIDTRTAIVLIGLMSLLMALVLFALRRSYPASIRGPGTWAAALVTVVAGSVFAAARGMLPIGFTTVLPNFLLCTGIYMAYAGTRRLAGQPNHPMRWMAFIVGVVALTAWYTWGDPSYVMRLRLVNLLMATLLGVHALFLLRQRPLTLARGLAATVLTLDTLAQGGRLVSTFVMDVGDSVLDNAPQHALYVSALTLSLVVFAVSAVLMAGDRLRAELEILATHDPLTNALTRRYLDEACQREIERSRRTAQSLSLILLDVDHFKRINDQHGHQVGDEVLIRLVREVQALLRKSDLLARFGGEEFVILLPATGLAQATEVAERIRAVCEQLPAEPRFTISLGVACATTDHPVDCVTLLRHADQALYRAKAMGRNRVEAEQHVGS